MVEAPSKAFLKRGGIAALILLLFFIIQSKQFRSLFMSEEERIAENTPKIENLGELIQKDSNKNDIPDWEERFWGLDPTVESTDGVAHSQIIAEKRATLSISTEEKDLTETERLSRELFILSSVVGGSTNGDLETIGAVSENAADEFSKGKELIDAFNATKLKTVRTNNKTLQTYWNALDDVVKKSGEENELELIARVVEMGDMTRIKEIQERAEEYKKLAYDLYKIEVPKGIAIYHMNLVNSAYNMNVALTTFTKIQDDTILGFIGYAQYENENERFSQALFDIADYTEKYSILTE